MTATGATNPATHEAARPVRLLFADDDTAFRETVLEMLDARFETIAVESAEQAIEIVESTLVDVALFDMHMHLLSGLDAIRWLRERQLELPCILMSSHVTDELCRQARELHAFQVLRKPPRRDQLIDTIQCALEL